MESHTVKISLNYEDSELLVIEKPPCIYSLRGNRESNNSVVQQLSVIKPELLEVNEECGLLQRLDYSTSGLMLVAKSVDSYNKYRQLFKDKRITKNYLVLVDQSFADKFPEPYYIENYLGSRYRSSSKVSVSNTSKPRFKLARSKIEFFDAYEDFARVKLTTSNGLRHQIRAQCAAIGFPLIGDHLYGSKQQLSSKFNRDFYLHAFQISNANLDFCFECSY